MCCFSLASQLFAVQDTGGTYSVGMSDQHVEESVLGHAPPPPTRASDAGASLVCFHVLSATLPFGIIQVDKQLPTVLGQCSDAC